MARGRRNRAEMALQGSFSNLTARIPTNLWEMLNDYARKNTANNRSLALERILREWQAWDNDVKEEIKDARLTSRVRRYWDRPSMISTRSWGLNDDLSGIHPARIRTASYQVRIEDDFLSRTAHLVLSRVRKSGTRTQGTAIPERIHTIVPD